MNFRFLYFFFLFYTFRFFFAFYLFPFFSNSSLIVLMVRSINWKYKKLNDQLFFFFQFFLFCFKRNEHMFDSTSKLLCQILVLILRSRLSQLKTSSLNDVEQHWTIQNIILRRKIFVICILYFGIIFSLNFFPIFYCFLNYLTFVLNFFSKFLIFLIYIY